MYGSIDQNNTKINFLEPVTATLELLSEIDESFNISCHTLDFPEQCERLLPTNSIKVLNINIRSLQKNFNAFLIVLARLNINFDAIVFAECWLTDISVIPQITGYLSFRTSKFINKCGGVVMYIKSCWSPVFTELPLDEANCVLADVPNVFSILGIDEKGPQLFHMDPSGTFVQYDAKAIGSGSEGAQQSLKEVYHKSMTLKEAIKSALTILKQVMEEKLSENNVEVVTMTPASMFHMFTREQLAEVIKDIP
ncbi:uncharacterized protein LOC106135282 isoform X1 [Amyelois transitella]|uniref:uncharacterized protein LOC106135282 isoform X1 n=1 Tax=Amyelois transitella TaxID=680683 RepID=UPI00067C0AF0|nr:uncharacterized protein LOC106135282 isoform X1 [Amyelois transitella]